VTFNEFRESVECYPAMENHTPCAVDEGDVMHYLYDYDLAASLCDDGSYKTYGPEQTHPSLIEAELFLYKRRYS